MATPPPISSRFSVLASPNPSPLVLLLLIRRRSSSSLCCFQILFRAVQEHHQRRRYDAQRDEGEEFIFENKLSETLAEWFER